MAEMGAFGILLKRFEDPPKPAESYQNRETAVEFDFRDLFEEKIAARVDNLQKNQTFKKKQGLTGKIISLA